jgi:hypothetical protein
MKKYKLWNTVKNEIVFWLLTSFISLSFLLITQRGVETTTLWWIGILGLIVLETWFLRVFLLHSARKISQYSNVIQRISFKDRMFEYFIIPGIFFLALMSFFFFNKSVIMEYFVWFLSMFLLLITVINIKSSLKHVYTLSSITKGVFDFLCIITFFLFLNILFRLGLDLTINMFIVWFVSLLMLNAELQLHDRLDLPSVLISVISSLFITFSLGCVVFQSSFVTTAVGTIAFYLIISIWNVRFTGKYKLVDYFPPLIYSLLALILVFYL